MRDSGRVDTSRGVTCPVSPARCALGPVVITGDIFAAPLTLGALLGHIVDRGTLGDTYLLGQNGGTTATGCPASFGTRARDSFNVWTLLLSNPEGIPPS